MNATGLLAAGCLLFSAPLWAADFKDYPDLPPLLAAQEAMQGYPMVVAARAGIRAGEAVRDRLAAGTHEFNITAGGARRRVAESGETFGEWSVALERGLRLPRKAELDRALGEEGVVQAENAYGDAMHEAGRKLLGAWFVWLRERAQTRQWEEQARLLKEQQSVVERRVKAGDAPRLEEELARAAVMQAEVSLQQAKVRGENATAGLSRYFPGLPLPAQSPVSRPESVEGDASTWLRLGLEDNHELKLARAGTRIAQLEAQRMDADRIPDPVVGAHYFHERGGQEQVSGISLSLPLPGGARRASSAEFQAKAEMAAQREALVLRRLEAEITSAYNGARGAYAAWQSAQGASALMDANAEKISRAYALGEMGLSDVLLARRQALEARMAATQAAFDAAEARYRLLLDSHQLWPLGSEEHEER